MLNIISIIIYQNKIEELTQIKDFYFLLNYSLHISLFLIFD